MRIVFFGTPEFAVPSLQALLFSKRHQIVAVVTQPDRPRGRHQRLENMPVKSQGLGFAPVLQPERLRTPEFMAELRSFDADLGVVAAYGKILPEEILHVPRLGMINVHASLLPRYRGAAPVHRAVMAGETETGVTIMRVIKALDAGAMFDKRVRPIGPDETSDAVERDLAHLGAALVLEVVDRLASGTATEEPQDDRLATYAPKLTKEESAIDWTLSAREIHNRVRGLHPWPLASTHMAGGRVIVWRTRVSEGTTDAPPGVVVEATRDTLHVATGGGGVIAIDEMQPEDRRRMTTREFLAGRPTPVGTVLGPG